MNDDLPDETTPCRFRNRLIEKGADKKMFKKINQQLELLGLKIESAKGAIVDATIIESAARGAGHLKLQKIVKKKAILIKIKML